MNNDHVTVVYKWTAQPRKLDELTSIYQAVTDAMEKNEPGAETVHVIATPGPFFFLGEVPDEMKQATEQMQLGGQFATHAAGFDR